MWRDGDPGRVPLPGQVHASVLTGPRAAAHCGVEGVCLRATQTIRVGEEVYIGYVYGATFTVCAPSVQGVPGQAQA